MAELYKGRLQSHELVVRGRGPGSESALSAVCSRRLWGRPHDSAVGQLLCTRLMETTPVRSD